MRRRTVGALAAIAASALVLAPTAAAAHSLESTTLSVHETREGLDTTVTIAVATLDEVLGTAAVDHDSAAYADQVGEYVVGHLSLAGADGTTWEEVVDGVLLETIDGIESVSVDVTVDAAGADPSAFTLTYDGVIEAEATHDAVVVLTDLAGDVSTAGVVTADDPTLEIATTGSTAVASGLLDMVLLGFEHVLEGADHLLFLTALLLTAPVVVVAGRWRRRTSVAPTVRDVLGIVTAFTLGHSLTLIASSLGWVTAPSAPVEILVAASVGVAGIHAVRPLARRGERLIAGGFGLVHGLAFAGILTDLGLDGTTSVLDLLAFNVGVELAQLAATAALFPSLYLIARTRFAAPFRVVGATIAVLAATGWVLDRLRWMTNPLGLVEDAVIAHPWHVVVVLAMTAAAAVVADRVGRSARPSDGASHAPATRSVRAG